MFSTPNYSKKQLQLQLTNSFVTNHDFICDCKKPTFHCMIILAKQLAPELTQQEKQQIIQCLGETDTTTEDIGTDLDAGELEKLFAEDVTDDGDG